jgi:hypothetical protein
LFVEAILENSDNRFAVYLDQNVFSRLQDGAAGRESVLELLDALTSKGAVFVYSDIHVDESRASNQPKAFVDIIEGISGYYLAAYNITDPQITLSPNRARDLILAMPDTVHEVQRMLERLMGEVQFCMGWLDGLDANILKEELKQGIQEIWGALEKDLPSELFNLLAGGKTEILRTTENMPLQQLKEEARQALDLLRKKLPKNNAQLDAIPDEEAVEYLFSQLDGKELATIRSDYHPQFWATFATRQEGKLAGFAFMLFVMGLVRNPDVKKRDRQRREKHFLGQFNDCQHIEKASRCAMFLTFDKGAARLAKSVYAYAGVRTAVIHLNISQA